MTRALAALLLLLTALLPASAWAGTPANPAPSLPGDSDLQAPPTRDAVFALPEALRLAFQRDVIEAAQSPEARLRKLVEFVFDDRKLGLTYQSEVTRTLSEAYATREVNCLTSTLLVVTLARQAGLRAYGQQVRQVLAWGTHGDIAIQSRHANAVIEAGGRTYMVDINARDDAAIQSTNPIGDDYLLALFHGNRATEQLVSGHRASARSSIDAALRLAPNDAGLLNNAAVIAQRAGDVATAERLLLRAAERNPREMSVLSNLIALYETRGDAQHADLWRGRAERILRKDPYYQYGLGLKHEQAGRHAQAAEQYRRAARLNPREHLFQFGLARAYAQLGDADRARQALSAADALSKGATQARYRDKLAALRNAGR